MRGRFGTHRERGNEHGGRSGVRVRAIVDVEWPCPISPPSNGYITQGNQT